MIHVFRTSQFPEYVGGYGELVEVKAEEDDIALVNGDVVLRRCGSWEPHEPDPELLARYRRAVVAWTIKGYRIRKKGSEETKDVHEMELQQLDDSWEFLSRAGYWLSM